MASDYLVHEKTLIEDLSQGRSPFLRDRFNNLNINTLEDSIQKLNPDIKNLTKTSTRLYNFLLENKLCILISPIVLKSVLDISSKVLVG